jgi:hypothetical protein
MVSFAWFTSVPILRFRGSNRFFWNQFFAPFVLFCGQWTAFPVSVPVVSWSRRPVVSPTWSPASHSSHRSPACISDIRSPRLRILRLNPGNTEEQQRTQGNTKEHLFSQKKFAALRQTAIAPLRIPATSYFGYRLS